MKKIAFLFPGQGAQAVGMGKDFYENFASAREIFEQADDILGRSLSTLVFEGPDEELTQTRNSQTGIYVMSMALLHVIEEQFPSLKATICAGLSLGEYTALTASGRIPFETCLPLVQYRGEFMNEACEASKGTMAALFGLSIEQVEDLVAGQEGLWAANFNCPGQTVISGTTEGIEAGMAKAKEMGAKRAIPLKVHGAFHSGLMKLAEEKLAPKVESVEILESDIQLVMNVPGDFVSESEEIRENMIKQVTHSVCWEQGIRAMQDVDLFVEIGPGRTLAGMNRQMRLEVPTITINSVADLEKLHETALV